MNKTATIRARVDPLLKEEAEDILQTLGLSTTQAITLFYEQVRLNKGLPFELRLPNAVTRQTFADTDAGENIARGNPLENKQQIDAQRLDVLDALVEQAQALNMGY